MLSTRTLKGVSIATIIAAVPVIMAVNHAYVTWHDGRYALREEVLRIAQAEKEQLTKTIDQIDKLSQQTAQSVNYLVKQAARSDVVALKQQLAAHELENDGSVLWKREKVRLENQLDGAQNYFDCISNERPHCEAEH